MKPLLRKKLLQKKFELLTIHESVLNLQGNRAMQSQVLMAMKDTAHRMRDAKRTAKALNLESECLRITANFDASFASAKKANRVAKRAGCLRELATSLQSIGNLYSGKGNRKNAAIFSRRSLRLRQQIGDKRGMALSLFNLGYIAWSGSGLDMALAYHTRSLRLWEQLGDQRWISLNYNAIGNIYRVNGNHAKARDFFHKSLSISQAIGDERGRSMILSSLGLAAAGIGIFDDALHYLNQSIAIAKTIGDKWSQAAGLSMKGLTESDAGRYDAALQSLQQSFEMLETIGDRLGMAWLLTGLGAAYHGAGQYNAAIEKINAAIKMCNELKIEPLLLKNHIVLADCFVCINEPDHARPLIETILKKSEGLPFEIEARPRLYWTLAQTLTTLGDSRNAAYLELAYQSVMQQADKLAASERQLFLENIPHNQAILAAWNNRPQR